MNIYDEVKVITHEEARKIVKSNHNKFYTEGTFTNDIQNYIAQCEAKDKVHEELVKKHDELVRDVKRYFELDNQDPFQLTQEEDLEWNYLHDKLSKVGEK